ncbi:MAG: S-methyl-5-thioribose-1-phosphate isomerase [Elusimicrobia bacterium]|nr:S-methyl-5-thioribose-1-phosphate isomerase [Elusimicrobiota bacterium]
MKPEDIISFDGVALKLLDQRLLPHKRTYIRVDSYLEVFDAIRDMAVRGAPAIGVAAAYGYLFGVGQALKQDKSESEKFVSEMKDHLNSSRPTAVNLFWALESMHKKYLENKDSEKLYSLLLEEAVKIHKEQIQSDERMAKYGSELLSEIGDGLRILTHCNAGALATGGMGTALGVIRQAYSDGLLSLAYATETRPRQQGSRLTCFELQTSAIPYKLICDTMPGYLMSKGMIDAVVLGADRIAENGDTANKIGTYQLAVLADRHKIPFYVAAPLSTFDFSARDGKDIPVEERSPEEILKIGDENIAPKNTKVFNPAFDITPVELIGAFITEKGIVKKPNEL